ncbi:MAG: type III secretion system chaperone [Woeseiaceae bacterium]|nr:type III secretion system chaperone [Woeseiaceae bacterium]
MRFRSFARFAVVLVAAFPLLAFGKEHGMRAEMTPERLGELILRVDSEAVLDGTTWLMVVEGIEAVVIFDPAADRMRIMIPIEPADELEQAELVRLMQANFDSALDARYAIAQGMLWGTYIHPLSTLTDEQFLVAIGQTVNVVTSYGTSYSSGLFIFGSGDSAEIERQRLIEELRRQTT